MTASTTKMSLDYMRDLGYLVDVVERWVGAPTGGNRIKHDLFGILDLVGVRNGVTVGVQTTSKSNVAARARKIAESEATDVLLNAGWLITVHGWWQPRGRGTRWEMEEIVLGREVL
jgi:hypothetical protein